MENEREKFKEMFDRIGTDYEERPFSSTEHEILTRQHNEDGSMSYTATSYLFHRKSDQLSRILTSQHDCPVCHGIGDDFCLSDETLFLSRKDQEELIAKVNGR